MISVKEMSFIRIAGASSRLKDVIDSLHELKLMHIENYDGSDKAFFEIGKPFFEASHYSQLLVRLRAVISFLGLKNSPKELRDLVGAEKKFFEIEKNLDYLSDKLKELNSKKSELLKKTDNPLIELQLDSRLFSGYKSVAVFKGMVKKSLKEELLKRKISNFEFVEKPYKKKFAIALFVPVLQRENALNVLANCGFVEYSVPENFSFSESVDLELKSVSFQISFFERQLAGLGEKNSQFLADLEFALKQLNEKAEAPLKFAVSRNAFVVSGWVPKQKVNSLIEKISKATNGTIVVEELHKSHDLAPIELDNPKAIRPFEFFLDLYALPKYYEIDPSFLMVLTFPLFFGFMLGDVGYGIVTLALFLILKKVMKAAGAKALLNIMILASIATILFGFVFGEFFGEEFIEHPLLNRAHDIYTMLGVSVFVGFVHLNIGLILGFYNKLKHHGLKHAILEKAAWFVLEAGAILIAADMFLHLISFGAIVGGILMFAAVVMLFLGEGPKGIIELPSIFSNMLSYARLFAVGLSSVSLALVVNKLAEGFFESGGLMVVVGILILVLGHAINLALGILGPFLHALRLHYVEFFSKFFEGGGKKFVPFGNNI